MAAVVQDEDGRMSDHVCQQERITEYKVVWSEYVFEKEGRLSGTKGGREGLPLGGKGRARRQHLHQLLR